MDSIHDESIECIGFRICDNCGKRMTEGYCIDDGREHYCSDECLHHYYSDEDFEQMYADGKGTSYYTTWDEEN